MFDRIKDYIREKDLVDDERDHTKKTAPKKSEVPKKEKEIKEDIVKQHIPSVFYKAQKKTAQIESFLRQMTRDEQILRKIALLEKRHTEFDRKSKDYEKRRDYVPNFSLLQKFNLKNQKDRENNIKEWWRRHDNEVLNTTEREKSTAPYVLSTVQKTDKSFVNLGQKTETAKNIISSQKRRSASRPLIRPVDLFQESAHSSRQSVSAKKSQKKKRDSFEDAENQLYNNAVFQHQGFLETETSKIGM